MVFHFITATILVTFSNNSPSLKIHEMIFSTYIPSLILNKSIKPPYFRNTLKNYPFRTKSFMFNRGEFLVSTLS